ncbi:BTAD domain-containing putative transcriptional regulator [Amycolatopsis thailandensis]|uniref:AfsR/SARP family transcriptional regulator n=1 Tax=Amycolatopsis thailandensis TaxID=589330 RepID=UPI0037AC72E6
MEFCLFGQVQLILGDQLVDVGHRRERGLLALLLLDTPRPVPVERLIDLLCDDDPPKEPRRAMQVHVSRLRKRLAETCGDQVLLTSQAAGYLIEVDPDAVDVHRFTRLVTTARRTADPADRARILREALALRRGPVCADLTSERLRRFLRDRLDEVCLEALESRVEADLAVGAHRELVGELAELTARHPARERLVAARMVALYRSGRSREALEVYQATAKELVEELGVDPGPGLRNLHSAILNDAPALAPPPTGEPPAPAQLPASLPAFTGRRSELAEMLDRRGTDAVVISAIGGMAGVGKTTLAVQVAHQIAGDYPDGQLFVDLHGFTAGVEPVEPAVVLDRLLRSLGTPGEQIRRGLDDRAAQFRSKLAGKRVLVVLDNAATEGQVRPLLPATPGCLALVTSRRSLTGLEHAEPVTLDSLGQDDAIELFARVAGRERVASEPLDVLAEVAGLCGRLPLALQVAAARLRARPAWTARHLAALLSDERTRLSELAAGDRSVAAALALSYRHLDGEPRHLFRLLALHRGDDISVPAAAALAGCDDTGTGALLEMLVDERLLDEPAPGRYRFHDLVRVYAGERALAEESEATREAAITRMLDWYLHTANAASALIVPCYPRVVDTPPVDTFTSRGEALAWLETERANLVAACHHASGSGRLDTAWKLPLTLFDLFYLRRYRSDWVRTSELGLAAARRTGDPVGEAWMLINLGFGYWEIGRYQDAFDLGQEALDRWRALAEPRGEASALHFTAGTYWRLGRHVECLDHFELALAKYHEAGDRFGTGWALASLGGVYLELSRLDDALRTEEQALMVWRELGDQHGEGIALNNLGDICRELGRLDDAIGYLEPALAVNRAACNRWGEAWALTSLGKVLRDRGHPAEARAHWHDALAIFDELGDPRAEEVHSYLEQTA